ncbi:MAG: hypothetical protein Q9174_005916, partial [Haloplaca sp. 1 TL-2023]
MATPLSLLKIREDRVQCPGPIPMRAKGEGVRLVSDSVDFKGVEDGLGLDSKTQDTFRKCLVDYGSGMFMDGWQGNICGGLGWYKGSKNSDIDAYLCYQICAPYLLDAGAKGSRKIE